MKKISLPMLELHYSLPNSKVALDRPRIDHRAPLALRIRHAITQLLKK